MFLPNFKILSQEVPEKTLMEKKFTDKHTDKLPSLLKRQKLYTPIYFVYRGYKHCYEQVIAIALYDRADMFRAALGTRKQKTTSLETYGYP